jgi:hypothetical protein
MTEEKYKKLYSQWKRDILKHEEQKMSLLDQIERLQLELWRREMNPNELYLVDKIEQLEREIHEKDMLLQAHKNCGKVLTSTL